MNILIVVPRFASNYGDFHHFPLGLAYIASALRDAGHAVFGLNLNLEFGRTGEIVQKAVAANKIDVCATGALSPFIDEVKAIFAAARAAQPNVINVCGGGIVSSDPDIALDLADIDIGIVGEGEESTVEALAFHEAGKDLSEVKGIVFRDKDGRTVRTANRPAVMDLTTLPWPDYELLGLARSIENQSPADNYFFEFEGKSRPRSIDMITSRSCPFSCTFCFHPVGKVYRERPLDDFFAELEYLIAKFDINMVIIVDELFSLRKARLMEFCERIKQYDIQWMVQLHVSSVDETTLAAMYEAGLPIISYGVESMSQPVLDSMQKKTKKERIDNALRATYENKIGIRANLIFGDTEETLETANESMAWWAKNLRYNVTLTRIRVFPGSPDYIMAVMDGMIDDRVSYSEKLPKLNIAKINDRNIDFLTFLMNVYRSSILNPVQDAVFRVSRSQIVGRDVAYDIDWTCPRCDHANRFERLVFGAYSATASNYLTHCRSCRSGFHVPNYLLGRKVYGITLNDRLGIDEATDAARHKKWVEAAEAELPSLLQRNKAALSQPYGYKRYTDPFKELHLAGVSLIEAPFMAARHVRFAQALTAFGAFGGAEMHLRQAMMLSPPGTFDPLLERLMASRRYAEKATVFFPSVSDETPVYRASRDTGGYNRKAQPAFPVYSRAANRKSVSANESDAA